MHSAGPNRDDKHMRELDYIPQLPEPSKNPDGLPIGFTKDDNPDTVDSYLLKKAFLGADYKRENYPTTNAWMGLTCAACHTAQIDYKGESIRIDGGPALVEQNATDLAYGYGRLDAFGAILNRVCETGLEIPGNHAESNAPVSFPFLWLTPQLDWVQWNSSVSSAIARNTGEVMGVYAHLQRTGTRETGQFNSTARLQNLDRIESYVEKLEAPEWPADLFDPIDEAKAEQGKSLFAANCKGCHGIRDADGKFPSTPPNAFGKQFVITHAPPLSELRTDPQMVQNVINRTADPGALRPYLDAPLKDLPRVPAATVLGAAISGVIKNKLPGESGGRRTDGGRVAPQRNANPGTTEPAAVHCRDLQGPATERHLGDGTLFAQRIGPEPLSAAFAGGSAGGEVRRRKPRIRPG